MRQLTSFFLVCGRPVVGASPKEPFGLSAVKTDSSEGMIIGDHVSKVKCTYTNRYNAIPTREQGKLRKDHEREVIQGDDGADRMQKVRWNKGKKLVVEGSQTEANTVKENGCKLLSMREPGVGVGVQGILGPLPRKIRERLELNETKSRERTVAVEQLASLIDIVRVYALQRTADLHSVDPAKVSGKERIVGPYLEVTKRNQHAYAIVDNEHGAPPPEERMRESYFDDATAAITAQMSSNARPNMERLLLRGEDNSIHKSGFFEDEERIYQPLQTGDRHKQAAEKSMFKELTPRGRETTA
ncbi:hypothetical protein EDD18DRAFT_1109702 [Armillaria luteobubalina]|uniref:Uncharacterized protein n=1 Tax=Armillaria luteobubalina TaxID=153913 RepID=A0AA39TI86_9AGAR|nr:hypothetical protein EDD18DRAFT_1109702 [Armillaria luteobubalina]